MDLKTWHRFWRMALAAVAVAGGLSPRTAPGSEFIVKDGKPQAEIVVAARPTRSAKLAACA